MAKSKLLKAIGKSKKSQMEKLYPGMSTASKVKSSAPKISKSKNVSSERGKVLRGPVAEKLRKSKSSKAGFKTGVAAGVASTYAVGKAKSNKEAKAKTDKLKKMNKEAIKKQKDKKKHHSK
jgi:hypothetical protein